jgi:shikimate dehydrogenase
MKRVFLIGDPVAHSVSPEMHNAAFQALGIDWRYELLPTPLDSLAQAVERLRLKDYVGANVTIPHKESTIAHVDAISDEARQIGAVNTIIKRNGRLIGENADAEGFLQVLANAKVPLKGTRTAILGAGGVARAAAFALARAGVCSIAFFNRTEARAVALATLLHAQVPDVELYVSELDEIGRAQIVVNATSVGMSPNVDASPWPDGVAFPREAIAYDLVYRPRRTRFLIDAERAGAKTIDGLGMLVHQGAVSFRLWTGRRAPVEIMFQAAERALDGQPARLSTGVSA